MRGKFQALFLILFSLLFFLAAYPLSASVPVDLFLRLDPLIAVTTFLASRGLYAPLLLSLIVIAASLFLGRFFCGYVCPLGTLIDFSKKLVPKAMQTETKGRP